jgi:outer membrane protein OmpA-like peptidoglycan-associated protein
MNIRMILAASTMLALPLAAQAQTSQGLYVGLGAGLNIMQNEQIKSVGNFNTAGVNVQTNLGAVGVGSVGWAFGNGLRTEVELDYRFNGMDKASGPAGSVGIGGSEQKFGPMVNVLYDFTTLSPSLIPYIGAGAGYQWIYENLSYGGLNGSQTEGVFAYQGIAGVAFPVSSVAGLSITGEYRFLGTAGDRNYSGVRLGNDYNHSILIGLRYAFGAAPAPAPMAPVPMMAAPSPVSRSYLVFFDWDKADLTDRARQIVSEAAANSTKVQFTQLEVNGYTDTSGTAKYNQGLSVRRAQAVAVELVKDGVPKSAITIQGFGETHPLVPTGPGVREPQNRRVEIIIK